MEKVLIRRGKKTDYKNVEEIMQSMHKLHIGFRPDIYKPSDTIYPREYYDSLVDDGRVLIAEAGGEILGLLSYALKAVGSDKYVARNILFINDVAVKDGYRKKGIGKLLMDAAKDIAVKKGLDGLELQVNSKNGVARKFYEDFGFTEKNVNMELKLHREKQ